MLRNLTRKIRVLMKFFRTLVRDYKNFSALSFLILKFPNAENHSSNLWNMVNAKVYNNDEACIDAGEFVLLTVK